VAAELPSSLVFGVLVEGKIGNWISGIPPITTQPEVIQPGSLHFVVPGPRFPKVRMSEITKIVEPSPARAYLSSYHCFC